MRRDRVARSLRDGAEWPGYLSPAYGGYCVLGVPGTCLSVLGAAPTGVPMLPADTHRDVDHGSTTTVLVVLIDGLGYDGWCRAVDDDQRRTDLLERFECRGTVTPLTAPFPSETAAALPSLHSGHYPVEHGSLGWWRYLDGVGRVQSLPYLTEAGDPVRTVAPGTPPASETLYDAESFYERMPADVRTVLFRPAAFDDPDPGGYDVGADTYVGYRSVPELAAGVRRELEREGRGYLFAYLPQIDALSHEAGPRAEVTASRLEEVVTSLNRALCRVDAERARETLVAVTADHGHIETDGHVDLTGNDVVRRSLAETADGTRRPPVGSPRQLQFHLRDGQVEAVRRVLERTVDCLTFTRAEYATQGLFGPGDPTPAFERSAPDLLCVPRTESVWFGGDAPEEVGMHGGLSPAEMLVPFAVANLRTLQ